MERLRSHMQNHGMAWFDMAIVLGGILLLVFMGLAGKAELVGEKWTQLALSQVAAHIVVFVRKLDQRCETAVRVGFAIAVAFAG